MNDNEAPILFEQVIAHEDMARIVYEHAMELWVNPEILSRHKQGQIKELPLVMAQAQIIFGLDGTYKVRLNHEVRGKIGYRITRDVKKGEALTYADVDAAEFQEKAPEDHDFGHLTIIGLGDNAYSVSFNFEYGATNILKYLKLGKEFLDQAITTVEKSPRSAMSLGMTAAENLIKARMAASPLIELKSKTHKGLMTAFSQFVRQNQPRQLKAEYVASYKFFKKNFDSSRYEPDSKTPRRNILRKHLNELKHIYSETLRLTKNLEALSLKSRQVKVERYS